MRRSRRQATDQAVGEQIQRTEQQAARARIGDLAREATGEPDPACTRRDVAR